MTEVNRRTFLASAGAGAVALAVHRPARAASANQQLRVGVVGIRGRGGDHIEGFCGHKESTVVALCDVDSRLFDRRVKQVEEKTGKAPQVFQDIRKLLDDKSIDAISVATPNHWHALATIWACQAGKDVYVEKPVCHNIFEGRKMIEAARKYGRVVQAGTQSRSSSGVKAAIAFLRSGQLGKIYMARGLCYKPRGSIGHKPDGPVPDGVDYDLWLGPAPKRPFNPNRFHYEWHWNWAYGNGDIGNQGIHQMDVARWGLGKETLPTIVESQGGRYGYSDDGETPNTQIATFHYDDCLLTFEVRGLPTNPDKNVKIGNLFYGSEGYMVLNGGHWATFFGHKEEPGPSGQGGGDHYANFIEAVQSRKPELLNAEILEGYLSSALCHLANISYRLGRSIVFDPKTETFGSDQEANQLLTREYRKPFVVPERV
jgi:predicted dehydrogenase